jgi:hypothetical protein
MSSWLKEQRNKALERYESCESEAMAYQYAAEAETYEKIRKGTLMFGGPRDALEAYENNADDADYGMTNARVRAIRRYLDNQ